MTMSTLLLLLATALPGPDRIELNPASMTIDAGETVSVTATAYDEDGTVLADPPVRWIAMNPEVAAVDQTGQVTGVSPGEARIAARTGNVMGFATVIVRALPVAALDVSLPQATLITGTSAPVLVRATAPDGEHVRNPVLAFTSSDQSVAAVDATGRVYARAAGEATIVITAGQARATVTVSVTAGDPGTVTVTPTDAQGRTGDVIRFQAEGSTTLHPEWTVGGSGAQIEADGPEGVFVAEEPGTYRITAMYGEGRVAVATATITTRIEEGRTRPCRPGGRRRPPLGRHLRLRGRQRPRLRLRRHLHVRLDEGLGRDRSFGNPVLTDSVQLDARRINDVKIHPEQPYRHPDPRRRFRPPQRHRDPRPLARSRPPHHHLRVQAHGARRVSTTSGSRGTWSTRFTTAPATFTSSTSRTRPTPDEIGRWGLPPSDTKSLHDVIVQDGYAYLSYWDDGAVMLDVGAGTHGGTPTEPAFVSRYKYPDRATRTRRGGQGGTSSWATRSSRTTGTRTRRSRRAATSMCWTWWIRKTRSRLPANEVPEGGCAQHLGRGRPALRRVLPGRPAESSTSPANCAGDLYRQGQGNRRAQDHRFSETTVPNWGMTWGAQIHKGHIFTSDLNSGLWVVKLIEAQRIIS